MENEEDKDFNEEAPAFKMSERLKKEKTYSLESNSKLNMLSTANVHSSTEKIKMQLQQHYGNSVPTL